MTIEIKHTGKIEYTVDTATKTVTITAATPADNEANQIYLPAGYDIDLAEGVNIDKFAVFAEVSKSSIGKVSKSNGAGCIERERDYC